MQKLNQLLLETTCKTTTQEHTDSEEMSDEEIRAILKPLNVDVSKHDAKQLHNLAGLVKNYSEI